MALVHYLLIKNIFSPDILKKRVSEDSGKPEYVNTPWDE